jgi:hypothetical protein
LNSQNPRRMCARRQPDAEGKVPHADPDKNGQFFGDFTEFGALKIVTRRKGKKSAEGKSTGFEEQSSIVIYVS